MARWALPGRWMRSKNFVEQNTRSPQRPPLHISTLILVGGSAAAILFLALPPAVLLIEGIQSRGWEGLPNTGITEALLLTLTTTTFSSLFTVLLGTPLAYVL